MIASNIFTMFKDVKVQNSYLIWFNTLLFAIRSKSKTLKPHNLSIDSDLVETENPDNYTQ